MERGPLRRWVGDLLLLVLLSGGAIAAYHSLAGTLPAGVIEFHGWFEADPDRVFLCMTDRWFDFLRTDVHPLFPSMSYPPVLALQYLFHQGPREAVCTVMATLAGIWVASLFVFLRLAGCRRLDAVLFSLLGAASSSAVFWFTVPETYGFGSVSIILALTPVALARHRPVRPFWFGLTGALSLGMTVTNWMVGILAAFSRLPWRRALTLCAYVFCAISLLCLLQKKVFPEAKLPLDTSRESRFLLLEESGGPIPVGRAFFLHGMVMPAFDTIPLSDAPLKSPITRSFFRNQQAAVGTGSPWAWPAVLLWCGLLVLGLHALVLGRGDRRVRIVLGLSLLGQLGLHLVYGAETFLYACHFVPLLVIVTALATLGRARIPALLLVAGLLVAVGANNLTQFRRAGGLLARMQATRDGPCLAGADLRRLPVREQGTGVMDLRGADLFAANARGANLQGRDLRGTFLRNTKLQGADLRNTDLRGAVLLGANLGQARLSRADLTRARAEDLYAGGADFAGAVLDSTWIDEGRLNGANLHGARIRDSAWTGVSLPGVDLGEAELRSVNLAGADLGGANLENARLQSVDLRGANLCGTRWSGALLESVRLFGAQYDDRTVWPDGFSPSREGVVLIGRTLPGKPG